MSRATAVGIGIHGADEDVVVIVISADGALVHYHVVVVVAAVAVVHVCCEKRGVVGNTTMEGQRLSEKARTSRSKERRCFLNCRNSEFRTSNLVSNFNPGTSGPVLSRK